MSPDRAARTKGVCPSKLTQERIELHQPVDRDGVGLHVGIRALLEQRLDQIQRIAAVGRRGTVYFS